MNISQAVANRIRELLKVNKMTQYKLEQVSGLSHNTIKSIMKGKAKCVNLRTLVLISYDFGISVVEFLNTENFKYKNLNID